MKTFFVTLLTFLSLGVYAQRDLRGLKYGTHSQQNLDLFLPDKYDAKTPVIIMLHGGAWMMGGKEYTDKTARDLRNRGFVVANTDYRYVNDSVHCADLLKDIDNAVQYLQNEVSVKYHFRASGYHISGISAGAHLALLYGYTTKRDIRSISALCAPSVLDNPTMMDFVANLGVLHNIELLADAKYMSGKQLDNRFTDISPYAKITNVPTIIFHGDKDQMVPYQSSVTLYNVLQQKQIDSKLVKMEGKGHDCGMNQPDSEQIVLDGITNWVKKYDV